MRYLNKSSPLGYINAFSFDIIAELQHCLTYEVYKSLQKYGHCLFLHVFIKLDKEAIMNLAEFFEHFYTLMGFKIN